jgi:hypothetical protein
MTLVKTGPYFVYVASVARTTVIIPLRYISQEAENRSHFILRKIYRAKIGKVPIVLSIFIAKSDFSWQNTIEHSFRMVAPGIQLHILQVMDEKNPPCP